MTDQAHSRGLQLRSLVTADATLELTLEWVDTPQPRDHEVIVQVEAAPINPSDLGLLLGGADPKTAVTTGAGEGIKTVLELSPGVFAGQRVRAGQSLPVGNEGSGIVIAAGSSDEAQALLGRTVGGIGGAMYSQYRCLPASACLSFPEGTSFPAAASWFVNPMTALAMVETMRMEGHKALIHTAAASNLGQMLVKICQQDGVKLVNVVRKPEQADLLRGLGAEYVCDSSKDTFTDDLVDALVATGATIAFDATGGGTWASDILAAMEVAANWASDAAGTFNRYGSSVHKQVYIYGGLDRGPTVLNRSFGMVWSLGGWLLTPFLMKAGPEVQQRLRGRVAAEINTTFASSYAKEISLSGVLDVNEVAVYALQATGTKFLVRPQL